MVFLQRTLKEKLPFLLRNTLLLHIPLLALTDRWTEWLTEEQIHSLRVGWRNFFSSCAVVSVLQLWREIVLGVTYLPYQLCCWEPSKVWSQRQQATSSVDLLFRLLWASALKYKKDLHTQTRNLNSGIRNPRMFNRNHSIITINCCRADCNCVNI